MKLENPKMRRVLCAVDVERLGSTSLSMASLLAERFHASLDALYATSPEPIFGGGGAQRVERLISEHNAQERLIGLLASVKKRVCVSSFVTRGNPSAVILTHSERRGSDLIVMASSPRRRVSGLPKTISPVAEHAACAVLTLGDRFQPAPLRRVLLPIGPEGVERSTLAWAVALASRFDAEVGMLRIGQPRSGLWKIFAAGIEPALRASNARHLDCEDALAASCARGIDAYEIAHPGGSDSDAVSHLCESGAFDAVVMRLATAGDGDDGTDALVAAVRRKTTAPVLSVRTIRPSFLFAPNDFEALPKPAVGAEALGA